MEQIYRYCDICRDPGDLIRCKTCSKCYHLECVSLQTLPEKWSCNNCLNSDGSVNNHLKIKRDKIPCLEKIKEWNCVLKIAQADFLLEHKAMFESFCDQKEFSKILSACNHKYSREQKEMISESAVTQFKSLEETPTFITATLRDYQLKGVSIMCSWFMRGVGGILADEMGLGKTIQSISVISCLKFKLGISGPHLVVVPLAVLDNWGREFTQFAPGLSVKKMYAINSTQREEVLSEERVMNCGYDVYLTTYEFLKHENHFFSDNWAWASLVIDEGHRIKNNEGQLKERLGRIRSQFRLLLTGTPLQNNLLELFSLLNFILPTVFTKKTMFEDFKLGKSGGSNAALSNVKKSTVVCCRKLLEDCMMVRRIKSDLETGLLPKIQHIINVPMTGLQQRWYSSILNIDKSKLASAKLKQSELSNIVAQLRKVINHPKQIYNKRALERARDSNPDKYLGAMFAKPREDLKAPEEGTEAWKTEQELKMLDGESLIQASAKLVVLDRLLLKLRGAGSRVLIFSQFTETLDVLEEYVNYRFGRRHSVYLRLDGMTHKTDRELDVQCFNRPGSEIFIYLLSTRAGGLGINLATADTVILYDFHYNPQTDLQAEDRAHRLGQKKQVTVYRLVTTNSIEERIMAVCRRKLFLDKVITSKEKRVADAMLGVANGDEGGLGRSGSSKNNKSSNSLDDLAKEVAAQESTERDDVDGVGIVDGMISNPNKSIEDEDNENALSLEYLMEIIGEGDNGLSSESSSSSSDSRASVKSTYQRILGELRQKALPNIDTIDSHLDDLMSDGSILSRDIFERVAPTEPTPPFPELISASTSTADPNAAAAPPPSGVSVDSSVESNNRTSRAAEDNNEESSSPSSIQEKEVNETLAVNSTISERVGLRRRQRVIPQRYEPILGSGKEKNTRRQKIHDDYCAICSDGGEILECGRCPKSYCLPCLGMTEAPKKNIWVCSWHFCWGDDCNKSAAHAGGKLFGCIDCPLSYCSDCFPKDWPKDRVEPTQEYIDKYTATGFSIPQSFIFYRCKECQQILADEKEEYKEKIGKRQAQFLAEQKGSYISKVVGWHKAMHNVKHSIVQAVLATPSTLFQWTLEFNSNGVPQVTRHAKKADPMNKTHNTKGVQQEEELIGASIGAVQSSSSGSSSSSSSSDGNGGGESSLEQEFKAQCKLGMELAASRINQRVEAEHREFAKLDPPTQEKILKAQKICIQGCQEATRQLIILSCTKDAFLRSLETASTREEICKLHEICNASITSAISRAQRAEPNSYFRNKSLAQLNTVLNTLRRTLEQMRIFEDALGGEKLVYNPASALAGTQYATHSTSLTTEINNLPCRIGQTEDARKLLEDAVRISSEKYLQKLKEMIRQAINESVNGHNSVVQQQIYRENMQKALLLRQQQQEQQQQQQQQIQQQQQQQIQQQMMATMMDRLQQIQRQGGNSTYIYQKQQEYMSMMMNQYQERREQSMGGSSSSNSIGRRSSFRNSDLSMPIPIIPSYVQYQPPPFYGPHADQPPTAGAGAGPVVVSSGVDLPAGTDVGDRGGCASDLPQCVPLQSYANKTIPSAGGGASAATAAAASIAPPGEGGSVPYYQQYTTNKSRAFHSLQMQQEFSRRRNPTYMTGTIQQEVPEVGAGAAATGNNTVQQSNAESVVPAQYDQNHVANALHLHQIQQNFPPSVNPQQAHMDLPRIPQTLPSLPRRNVLADAGSSNSQQPPAHAVIWSSAMDCLLLRGCLLFRQKWDQVAAFVNLLNVTPKECAERILHLIRAQDKNVLFVLSAAPLPNDPNTCAIENAKPVTIDLRKRAEFDSSESVQERLRREFQSQSLNLQPQTPQLQPQQPLPPQPLPPQQQSLQPELRQFQFTQSMDYMLLRAYFLFPDDWDAVVAFLNIPYADKEKCCQRLAYLKQRTTGLEKLPGVDERIGTVEEENAKESMIIARATAAEELLGVIRPGQIDAADQGTDGPKIVPGLDESVGVADEESTKFNVNSARSDVSSVQEEWTERRQHAPQTGIIEVHPPLTNLDSTSLGNRDNRPTQKLPLDHDPRLAVEFQPPNPQLIQQSTLPPREQYVQQQLPASQPLPPPVYQLMEQQTLPQLAPVVELQEIAASNLHSHPVYGEGGARESPLSARSFRFSPSMDYILVRGHCLFGDDWSAIANFINIAGIDGVKCSRRFRSIKKRKGVGKFTWNL